MTKRRGFGATSITLIYAAFAGMWIVVSGSILFFTTGDPVLQGRIEILKGLTFVAVTSGLLYFLLQTRRRTEPTTSLAPEESSRYENIQLTVILAVLVLTVPLIGFAVFALNAKQAERDALGGLHAIAEFKTRQVEGWLA